MLSNNVLDMKRICSIMLTLILANCALADTQSPYQDSFEQLWTFDAGGDIRDIKIANIRAGGMKQVVSASYYISSVGRSGSITAIDSDGSQIWKYFPGPLEDVYTTEKGNTAAAAGPYMDFIAPSGTAFWKRAARSSPTQLIFSQRVWVGDIRGRGEDDVLLGSIFGGHGSVLMGKDESGEDIFRITLKSIESPNIVFAKDISADGKPEILVGAVMYARDSTAGTWKPSYNGHSSIMVYDSKGSLIWRDGLDSGVSALNVCDLDSDGRMEVIVGSMNRVTAYSHDGAQLWSANVAGQVNAIDCADLEGDGSKAVVAGAARTIVLDSDGKTIWTYSSSITFDVRAHDFTGDGKSEIVIASDSLRILSNEGKLLYRSQTFGRLNALDIGDINNDGYDDVAFAGSDGKVRALSARKYAIELAAVQYLRIAQESYEKKDYNATIENAKEAERYFQLAQRQSHSAEAQRLYKNAEHYILAEHHHGLAARMLEEGDYNQALSNADKAMQEYRAVSDIRRLNELSEIKTKAQMIPDAAMNMDAAIRFFEDRNWANASAQAAYAKSAYNYLGNETQVYKARDIENRSLMHIEFERHIIAAESNFTIGLWQNASHAFANANRTYHALNDPLLEPDLSRVKQKLDSVGREDRLMMYAGFALLAVIAALFLAFLALLIHYLKKKGLFGPSQGFGPAEIKSERRDGPIFRQNQSSGLRGVKGGLSGSLGGHRKRW